MSALSSSKLYFQNYGAVSCFGLGVQALCQGIFAGKSGMRSIARFSTKSYLSSQGGEVLGWEKIEKKNNSWAFTWAKLAIEECCGEKQIPANTALVVSTTLGNIEKLTENCFSYHQLAEELASFFRLEGPVYTLNTACSSSLNSILFGWDLLQYQKKLEQILVVGVDSLSEFVFSGFSSLKALAAEKISPFSKERKGLLLSEGAGALLLKREPSSARICLKGFGNSGDANHLTGPHPQGDGLVRAIQTCLAMSEIEPSQIDYINAHGTGTPYNDLMETTAFHRVFGESAKNVPISSSKSMIGHALGAAGALESIICLEAIKRQLAPPTIHYNADPECDLDYIPEKARSLSIQFCLKTASGFGGQNTALLFEKESDD